VGGSYALQALGGDRASTNRVGEDAAERPSVKEAERTTGRRRSSMGSHGAQRHVAMAIAETATS
jgi:hypothetical protein